MHVVYDAPIQLKLSVVGIDDVSRPRLPLLKQRRSDEGLECRTRLEWLGHSGVGERSTADTIARHRQNFTSVGIHHHDIPTIGVQTVDRNGQLALADILQRVVDGEQHGRTLFGRIGPAVRRI